MISTHQKGFSLVELSIVVLVMGLLLGGLMMPLSIQKDNANLRDGREQIETALNALHGYALVNGAIPCPATAASDGLASVSGGGCSSQHGFLPATTLDLNGRRNDDNLLLDPWGSPLRYSVSTSDADSNGNWDFVNAADIQAVGMANLVPDLSVCSTAAGSTATQCANPATTLTEQAPLLVYSFGKDWSSFSSADQVENAGANLGGGPSGITYRIAGDAVFVSRGISAMAGSEYDDVLLWMSANDLYRRLVDAGHLP